MLVVSDLRKEVVKCPFNPNHTVSRNRIVYHIIKCKESCKSKKVRCPYNATEYIEPEDMVNHIGECPYRVRYLLKVHDSVPMTPERKKTFEHKGVPHSDENWGIDSPSEDEDDQETDKRNPLHR